MILIKYISIYYLYINQIILYNGLNKTSSNNKIDRKTKWCEWSFSYLCYMNSSNNEMCHRLVKSGTGYKVSDTSYISYVILLLPFY